MKYTGGKGRVARELSLVILGQRNRHALYVEPFLGSAAIAEYVVPQFERAVLGDVMPDLVLMWQALQDGWVPPETVSEEMYQFLRKSKSTPRRGFVGFCCSYSGKWFGGYARDPQGGRNYAAEGARSVCRRGAAIKSVAVRCADYTKLRPHTPALIYCDPPYAGTLGYSATGTFDHERFWSTMRQWSDAGHTVLVSEYVAPAGWEPIWSKERHVSTALQNAGARSMEHLFARVA